MASERDREVLVALTLACADELGGWATPLPVAEHCGLHVSAVNNTLARLAREGYIEVWSPRGGKNKLTSLYRPSLGRVSQAQFEELLREDVRRYEHDLRKLANEQGGE